MIFLTVSDRRYRNMHNLRYIWNPGLDKATRISLKNRRCSLNEVDAIYHVLLVL